MRNTFHNQVVVCLFLLLVTGQSVAASLRIEHLERCGDLFNERRQEFCLRIAGDVSAGKLTIKLDGKSLPDAQIKRDENALHIRISSRRYNSGPLWIEHNKLASNAVWRCSSRASANDAGSGLERIRSANSDDDMPRRTASCSKASDHVPAFAG